MADIVNLRRFRKAGQRAEKAAAADRNRAAFGRTAAERAGTLDEVSRRESLLDGHRLAPAPARPPSPRD